MVAKSSFPSRPFALASLMVLALAAALWPTCHRRGAQIAFAQTLSGCPEVTDKHKGWAQGTTVYYDISNLSEPLKSQAQEAFRKWSEANKTNGSNVEFKDRNLQNPPPAAAITFAIGPVPDGGPSQASIRPHPDTGIVESAEITIDADNPEYFINHPAIPGYDTAYLKAVLHEIGHTMGLKDAPYDKNNSNCGGQTGGNSVMNLQCGPNDMDGMTAVNITDCDNHGVQSNPQYPRPTPTPTPGCMNEAQQAADCAEQNGNWIHVMCYCDRDPSMVGGDPQCASCINNGGAWCVGGTCGTPVLIDTLGDGFRLTSAAGGVLFDRDATGAPLRTAWTEAGSDDAWLALDRDGDGLIGDGRELFGDKTPQAPSALPNGFAALAEFDRPGRGGNSDGVIDARDAVFWSLRLWRDSNHDGVSQPEELSALPPLGVESVSLDYRESRRRDEHGNWFRYRAKVEGGGRAGRWAYDVWLRTAP